MAQRGLRGASIGAPIRIPRGVSFRWIFPSPSRASSPPDTRGCFISPGGWINKNSDIFCCQNMETLFMFVESNVGLLLLLYVLIKNSDIFCCQSTEALLLCVESNVDMLLLYVRKQCFCFYFLRYGRFFLKYLNLKNNSL